MSTSNKQERDERGRLKKGSTANPHGRPPKGYSITEAFREMLSSSPETKAEIVESIRKKALQGDATAQKLIWNYMDGMPKQDLGIEGKGEGGAIEIVIKKA